MDKQTLQNQFRDIWASFSQMMDNGASFHDNAELLRSMNSDIAMFLSKFSAFLDHLAQQIEARRSLQEVMDKAGTPQQAYRIFYEDQIYFYQNWLSSLNFLMTDTQQKCTLGLTSRQILLFLRLAREMELLDQTQLKPYFYFLQNSFKTEFQEKLSYESLRKKYSQLDARTVKNTRNLLENMLRKLDGYKL